MTDMSATSHVRYVTDVSATSHVWYVTDMSATSHVHVCIMARRQGAYSVSAWEVGDRVGPTVLMARTIALKPQTGLGQQCSWQGLSP